MPEILSIGNENENEENLFIVIHNHRKVEKSKRRKLLRKYKRDLEMKRLNLKLRQPQTKIMGEK